MPCPQPLNLLVVTIFTTQITHLLIIVILSFLQKYNIRLRVRTFNFRK